MIEYQHDTERWLRSQASLYRACHNRELAGKFTACAGEVGRMKSELAALKHVANMLCLFAQPILGDDDNFLIMKTPLEKLAALVGEEGR